MPDRAEPWTRATLPRPFQNDPWQGEVREAAHVLWDWHQGVLTLLDDSAGRDRLRSAAIDVCRAYSLDTAELDAQESAADELTRPLRFETVEELDAFLDRWTAAHGRLLAGLAGLGGYSWHHAHISVMSRGFAMTAALMVLPEDLAADRVFVPLTDLDRAGVSVEELREGRMTPDIRKVIWKQVVRARDSFAQSQQFVDDLTRRQAASFRRWWFAALEMLNVIEANQFDVFTQPPHLSRYRRWHARFQARFGRTTFR